jgi:predicted nucleic acid-binding protein
VIAYVDASALVKRYVTQRGSDAVRDLTARADVVATSLVSRAEVAAALAKAVRYRRPVRGRGAQSPPHVRRRVAGSGAGADHRDACRAS